MIRRAGPGDVNALRAIAAAAYHTYVPRIGWNPAPMTAGYAQPVRNRQARAAVEDDEIAGFAILIARPGCGWSLYPAHHRDDNSQTDPVCRAGRAGGRGSTA